MPGTRILGILRISPGQFIASRGWWGRDQFLPNILFSKCSVAWVTDNEGEYHAPRRRTWVAACLLLFCTSASAAVVALQDHVGTAGQTVAAAISFSSEGQTISGLQFDLEWDSPLDVRITVGARTRGSTKLLYTAPTGPHGTRCLFIGYNRDTLGDGELLNVFIVIAPDALAGAAMVRFTNAVATTPDGTPVVLRSQAASVGVQSGSAPQFLPPESMLNAGSLLPGPVAPGEIVTLLGFFPPAPIELLFNGVPAPILYTGLDQVNAIVPFSLDSGGPVHLEARSNGRTVAQASLAAAPVVPAIFTLSGTGIGPGAVLNQDYSVNSLANPAAAGSVIMVYGTGFGALDPPAVDGQPGSTATTVFPVTAAIAGIPAEVTYAGAAPGLVAGIAQINVRIPSGLSASFAASVSLMIGSAFTQFGVTIAIQ